MLSRKLQPGSKGKLAKMLQEILNRWGKLPKSVPEDGKFGNDTKEAVRYFQKKAGLKNERDGTVGSETATALADEVGGSKADTFAKEFALPGDAEADANSDKKDEQKANESAEAKADGKPSKHVVGNYVISIPPDPDKKKLPLLILFGGTPKAKYGRDYLSGQMPPNYFKKAVLVFSEWDGKVSAFESQLYELLDNTETRIKSVSICGYSAGGIGAFANYKCATKKVGLIDPTIKGKDFKKFDAKTILSINPRPSVWDEDDSSYKKGYTVGQTRIDALEEVKKAGGYSEKQESWSHTAYPKKFLGMFEKDLI